jgi:uncharacterized membrane protein YeaQ/YmgE (transglycosylase-associated protein family)
LAIFWSGRSNWKAGKVEKRQIAVLHGNATGRQSVRQQNGTESFRKGSSEIRSRTMHILWLILIGFVAGVIAKFLHPGSSNEPSGFILTTLLGIAGSFVATYLGQALGWYQAGEGAGLIGAVVGAIIVLVVWGLFTPRQPTNVA